MVPRLTLSALAFAALSLGLTGCAPSGCVSRATTPTEAVTGLLHDLPEARSPQDICEYVSEGWEVSDAELAQLKSHLSDLRGSDVTFVEGEQMAASITVDVLKDGVVEHTFALVGDDHNSHWTIELGTVRD
jgi:hypothetical protein